MKKPLLLRLVQTLMREHEMKCDLLGTHPPSKGDHCVSTCTICEIIQETYRKTSLYRKKKKEIMEAFK